MKVCPTAGCDEDPELSCLHFAAVVLPSALGALMTSALHIGHHPSQGCVMPGWRLAAPNACSLLYMPCRAWPAAPGLRALHGVPVDLLLPVWCCSCPMARRSMWGPTSTRFPRHSSMR